MMPPDDWCRSLLAGDSCLGAAPNLAPRICSIMPRLLLP
jgi:hypothetical protein